jgi:putative hemolysin
LDDDPGSSSLWAVMLVSGGMAGNTSDFSGEWLTVLLKLILISVCAYLSAIFSGSEVAILSVNRIRLLELREQNNFSAKILLEILKKPNQIVSTLLVGNTTVNVVMVVLWTSILLRVNHVGQLNDIHLVTVGGLGINAGSLVLLFGGLLLTLFIVLFCEVLPKNLFHKNPEYYALKYAGFLESIIKTLTPLVWFTFNISKNILKLFGVKISSASAPITEDEIIDLIETGEHEGLIQEQEKEMIHSIFEFGDLRVRDVMVPRVDMNALKDVTTMTDALKMIVETGHSRVPVYHGNRDNIIGLIYAKDLLEKLGAGDIEQFKLIDMVREVEFVPEEMLLSNLFGEMKRKKNHFAIVADEYGGTAGLVSIEDVLEEIVGEIEDEYDVEEPLYRKEQSAWIVDGKLNLHDLEDIIETEIPENGADTVGGLLYQHLGRIPNAGDTVNLNEVSFTVRTVDNQRISEVEIRIVQKTQKETQMEVNE